MHILAFNQDTLTNPTASLSIVPQLIILGNCHSDTQHKQNQPVVKFIY